MCLSLVTSVTAYDDVEIIDVGCCSDHDVWLNHFNVEPINFNVGIMATVQHIKRWMKVGSIVINSVQINSHLVPVSGGSGPMVNCNIFLDTRAERSVCTACGEYRTDSTFQVTRHSISH